MRKQTEEYWRTKIAIDIQNEINFHAWGNYLDGGTWGEGMAKAKEISLGRQRNLPPFSIAQISFMPYTYHIQERRNYEYTFS